MIWYIVKKIIHTSVQADSEHEAVINFLKKEKEGKVILDIEVYPEETGSRIDR